MKVYWPGLLLQVKQQSCSRQQAAYQRGHHSLDAHEKNKALNDLNERFLKHHEIAQRVVDRQQQQQGDLHDTQRDINLLNNRQYIKKLILLTLVLVLGLIDIALFIRRITRFF